MTELDPDLRNLLAMLGADPGRPKLHELSPAAARTAYVRMNATLVGPPAPVAQVEDRTIAGPGGPLALRIYTPAGEAAAARPGIVFFHGGGWVVGNLDTHDTGCRALAAGTGAVVVSVDYRLAPEHRFPAAVEDAHAATRAVASEAGAYGIDPARLAVAGDSAGANLAAVVAQLARDEGLALVHQLLIYPVTSGRADTPSHRENARGYMLEQETMDWFFAQYARAPEDRDNKLLAPLQAPTLEGLPPATIATAGFDPLRDDGRLYAAALERSGVPTRLLEFPTLVHGFFLMGGVSAGARAAVAAIVEETRKALVRG